MEIGKNTIRDENEAEGMDIKDEDSGRRGRVVGTPHLTSPRQERYTG